MSKSASARPQIDPEAGSLSAAKHPVANGSVPLLGVLWALALIALGVVLIREALLHAGVVSGQRYVDRSVTYLDNRAPADWMVGAGVVAALVGLVLVMLALLPRRRKELALKAKTGVFLTTASVRHIAKTAASDVDGIDTSSVSATRNRVSIDATAIASDTADAKARIEETVRRALSSLTQPPTITVKVRSTGGNS